MRYFKEDGSIGDTKSIADPKQQEEAEASAIEHIQTLVAAWNAAHAIVISLESLSCSLADLEDHESWPGLPTSCDSDRTEHDAGAICDEVGQTLVDLLPELVSYIQAVHSDGRLPDGMSDLDTIVARRMMKLGLIPWDMESMQRQAERESKQRQTKRESLRATLS